MLLINIFANSPIKPVIFIFPRSHLGGSLVKSPDISILTSAQVHLPQSSLQCRNIGPSMSTDLPLQDIDGKNIDGKVHWAQIWRRRGPPIFVPKFIKIGLERDLVIIKDKVLPWMQFEDWPTGIICQQD